MNEKMKSGKRNKGSLIFLIIFVLIFLIFSFFALKGATIYGYRFLTFKEAIYAGIEFKGGLGFNVHVSATVPPQDNSTTAPDNSTTDTTAATTTDTTSVNTTQAIEIKANSNDFYKTVDIINSRLKKYSSNINVMAVGDSDIRIEAGKTVDVNTCRLFSTVGLVEFKDVPADATTTPAKVVLNSDDIKSCGALYNRQSRTYTLQFLFKDKAKLKSVTTEYLNKSLNLLLDNNQVIETTINAISDNGILNVSEFTNVNQINLLSVIVNDGKLPASTAYSGVFPIYSPFGADIGMKIIVATSIILLLVLIILLVLFKASGIMTFMSIAAWGWIWLLIFITLGETFNLPVMIGAISSFFALLITSIYILNNLKKACVDDSKIINSIDHTYSSTSKQIIFANVGLIFVGIIVFLVGGASYDGISLAIMLGSACTLLCVMVLTRLLFKSVVNSGLAKDCKTFIGTKGGM